jgi:hypothetical protein
VADPNKKRIAKLVRQFSAAERGVRANAWEATERALKDIGANWSDVGNWIEGDDEPKPDPNKYTEADLQEFGRIQRAEGVEAGIRLGQARAGNGGSNGYTLPKAVVMAQYCHDRLSQLKDDRQRDFVSDIFGIAQRGRSLTPGRLGYLASIYIQIGGRI